MKEMLPWVLFSFSMVVSITLGSILEATKSDDFRMILTAAQSIHDSRQDIRSSVLKFNTAVINIENLTEQVQGELGKVDTHVKNVRGDLGRIESLLKF